MATIDWLAVDFSIFDAYSFNFSLENMEEMEKEEHLPIISICPILKSRRPNPSLSIIIFDFKQCLFEGPAKI